jgi:hypothetical protein
MVPGPGLEPGYSAPKADVLPIRRSRNGLKEIVAEGCNRAQTGNGQLEVAGKYGGEGGLEAEALINSL